MKLLTLFWGHKGKKKKKISVGTICKSVEKPAGGGDGGGGGGV